MMDAVSLPLLPQPSLLERGLDTLNPLQHIPFVSYIYRQFSGDTITPDAQFAGGFLYGGPLGALGATASMIIGGAFDTAAESKSSFSIETKDASARIHYNDPWRFNA